MRYVSLPVGGPELSVLGLGCAAMMGSASRRQSLAALAAAHDVGINFFDTARSYGYGASESLLGEFCRPRRAQVVLCTKFGILPAPRNWKHSLKPLARAAVSLFPGLRGAARAHTDELLTANQFSVPLLRASLDSSLRELQTDYVDILLMHAAPMSVLAQHDLFAELERLVSQGKIRMAGISAAPDVIRATFAQRPLVLQTAQFACDIDNFDLLTQPLPRDLFLVANHPFGGVTGVSDCRNRIDALRPDPLLSADLRARLDPRDPQLLPEIVLNAILIGTGIDALVAAMMQPSHLRSNCRALTECRFSPAELAQLRHALASPPASPAV